jgi:hypothetical protein
MNVWFSLFDISGVDWISVDVFTWVANTSSSVISLTDADNFDCFSICEVRLRLPSFLATGYSFCFFLVYNFYNRFYLRTCDSYSSNLENRFFYRSIARDSEFLADDNARLLGSKPFESEALEAMGGNLMVVCFLNCYFSIQNEIDYINVFHSARWLRLRVDHLGNLVTACAFWLSTWAQQRNFSLRLVCVWAYRYHQSIQIFWPE